MRTMMVPPSRRIASLLLILVLCAAATYAGDVSPHTHPGRVVRRLRPQLALRAPAHAPAVHPWPWQWLGFCDLLRLARTAVHRCSLTPRAAALQAPDLDQVAEKLRESGEG